MWLEVLPDASPTWCARIDFWYEDEAERFETGFGLMNNIKGWQMYVWAVASSDFLVDLSAVFSEPIVNTWLPCVEATGSVPTSTLVQGSYQQTFASSSGPPPPAFMGTGMDYAFQPQPMSSSQADFGFPPMGPPLDYIPPWASHNPFTIQGVDMPPTPQTGGFQTPVCGGFAQQLPFTPESPMGGTRRSSAGSLPASVSRPDPKRSSGLVDHNNVFVSVSMTTRSMAWLTIEFGIRRQLAVPLRSLF